MKPNDTNVTTEELERLVTARRECGHEFLTDGCSDCGNWRTVREGWSELRDKVSYEDFAREVLAQRKWAVQAREALRAIVREADSLHNNSSVSVAGIPTLAYDALAAMKRGSDG